MSGFLTFGVLTHYLAPSFSHPVQLRLTLAPALAVMLRAALPLAQSRVSSGQISVALARSAIGILGIRCETCLSRAYCPTEMVPIVTPATETFLQVEMVSHCLHTSPSRL